MFLRYTSLLICLLCTTMMWAQQVEKSQYGSFALTNATIHTVTNGTVNGTVLINDGMITGVGNVSAPGDATVIDCEGLHIYPGMIDAGTRLGLGEIGSVSLTQDANEIGDLTPQMKALTAVNPNSVLIPVTRVSGVTTVLTRATGGMFPGTAALIDLHGYTPDQMYSGYEAVLLNFPYAGRRGWRDKRSEDEIKKDQDKALKKLNDTWEQAVLYHKIAEDGGESDIRYNPEMEALSKVVSGEVPLHIEVNQKSSILAALNWIKDKEIIAVLTGVSEGWRVADSIAAAGVPVITGPVLMTPRRSSDRYDAPYKNAGVLAAAGIKVAIRTNETENVRNLPYNAGFAAAYGMGTEEALKAITINPAEIFGVADKYGSIENGKVANLFVANGDPFETQTDVEHLFIRGWKVPLESRHTLLYDEFLERSPGVEGN